MTTDTILTDAQCDEFRRFNGSFDDIVRHIYHAATAAERERCARVCESLGMTTSGIYERNQECADKIRSGE